MPLSRHLPSLSAAMVLALVAGPFWSPDAAAQSETVITTASDGTQAAGAIGLGMAISRNGRFVVFGTTATNLVPGDNNGVSDVFVKDRETNQTTRVSVASDGTERSGPSGEFGVDISDDGQIVVFTSKAAFVADDTNECLSPAAPCQDIYVHNRATGQTTRVSVATGGAQANNYSDFPSISGDGRYVSFTSHASNLAPGDTNGAGDIFLHDRQTGTTTRASVDSAGAQGAAGLNSARSELNGDGSVVVFLSEAVLSNVPDPNQCLSSPCDRAFMHVRATGATTRVPLPIEKPFSVPAAEWAPEVQFVQIDASGRSVSLAVRNNASVVAYTWAWLFFYDRQTEKSTLIRQSVGTIQSFAASGDGQIVSADIAAPSFFGGGETVRYDRANGHLAIKKATPSLVLSFDGEFGLRVQLFIKGGIGNVVLLDYDVDNDRMDDVWETAFGLDPNVADGAGDVDGDGITNLAEHDAGTHPNGVVKRYLAEGAVNEFFTTQIALFNPNEEPAIVSLRFLGSSGQLSSHVEPLLPHERKTVVLTPTANIPENDFSTVIESNRTVVADRAMTWQSAFPYGSHAETAVEAPATTWYLAEGATHGGFSLFYLLQNPNDSDAAVTIDYLRLAPATPVTKSYTVPRNSRVTIQVDTEAPELEAADLAARITSNVPIIAERAMYSTPPTTPLVFLAGHGGAGVTSPALKWFLAEGATGSFFDLYVLVANPSASDSELKVTYMFPIGEPLVKTYKAGANNRLTISVKDEDPRLADTPVSIVVESVNNQPVVVERAMWYPSGYWYEAHLSAGTTTTGTKWALADGEVDRDEAKETYILIANTSASPGTATVRFYREGIMSPMTPLPWPPITVTIPLQPNSRTNVQTTGILDLDGHRFSTIVESDVPIVVERAMYQSSVFQVWALGTSAVGTKLQ